jgi:hypothetical protein
MIGWPTAVRVGTVTLVLLLPGLVRPAGAQQRFSAFAIGPAGGPPLSTVVEIAIDRLSDPADRARFLDILKSQGPTALWEAFRSTNRVGHLSIPSILEIDLEYVEELPGKDGARRVILAGYRNVSMREQSQDRARSLFPFTALELRFKPKGDGEGTLALQAQLSVGKNGELKYEDFSAPSVQLKKVRLQ